MEITLRAGCFIIKCIHIIHSNVLISPTDYDTSWTGGSVRMRLNKEKNLIRKDPHVFRSEFPEHPSFTCFHLAL